MVKPLSHDGARHAHHEDGYDIFGANVPFHDFHYSLTLRLWRLCFFIVPWPQKYAVCVLCVYEGPFANLMFHVCAPLVFAVLWSADRRI